MASPLEMQTSREPFVVQIGSTGLVCRPLQQTTAGIVIACRRLAYYTVDFYEITDMRVQKLGESTRELRTTNQRLRVDL